MKKITFLFCIAVLSSFTALAQFTFPADAGPYIVSDGTPVPVAVNDAANSAGVTAGVYNSFTVTADWTVVSGDPWSDEEAINVITAAGTTLVDPPTAGGATDEVDTNLTFSGALAGLYDPSVDATLSLELFRSYTSDTGLSNIIVTLDFICIDPTGLAASNMSDVSADISWNASGGIDYNVEVYNIGESPGLFMPVFTDAAVAGAMTTATGLTESSDYDVYITANCGGALVGPVSFTTSASCADASGIGTGAITQTTAEVTWTPGTGNDMALVEVYASGESAATMDTPLYTNASATGGTDTATGLTAQTDYDIYVTGYCGATATAVQGPTAFATACGTFTAPYTEDFETFTTGAAAFVAENCWTGTGGAYYWESAPGTDTGSGGTGPNPSITTGNYFYTEASAGTAGDITDLVSPSVDLTPLTAPALSFNYHMFGGQIGTLDVLVNGTTNVWTLSGEQQATDTTPWGIANIDLAAYAGQTISITFRATRAAGSWEGDISIDNVAFEEAPACFLPAAVTNSVLTDTSADFTWTTGGTETTWEYANLTSPSTDPASGTSTMAMTAAFTGLIPETAHDFYVRSDCGGSFSDWVKISYTTPATPATAACGAYTSSPGAAITTGTPVNDVITVTGTGPDVLTDLNVIIDLEHTFLGDLDITLISPAGTMVGLIFDQCGVADDMSVTFDDAGAAIVCGSPLVGTIVPSGIGSGVLADFNNESFDGDWTLNVVDDAGGDDGTLLTWCLLPTLGPAPIANDECAGAMALTLGADMAFDNTGATDSAVAACYTGTVSDLWYSFDAPMSGDVTITVGAGTQYALFSGACGALVQEGTCSQTAHTGLAAGTYYVSVTDDGTLRIPGASTLRVDDTSTLSTTDFDNTLGFSYYPNPVNNTLTLNANQAISNVAVFNMLGQEVIRTAPNAVSNELNMSNLQSGAYFVQVTIGSAVETVRIIKN